MKPSRKLVIGILVLAGVSALIYGILRTREAPSPSEKTQAENSGKAMELNAQQLSSVKVEEAQERSFASQREAIGSIDFNQDKTVAVFAPYPGKIINAFATVGQDVKKGQPLFALDSTDLVQAESTLISTAGILAQTDRALKRAQALYKIQGIAQKDLEQAKTDEQTAAGNFRAARNNLHVFGKTDGDIKQILKTRQVDRVLVVPSPFAGRVTARSAAPGLFVQPGNTPAPYAVADISSMWMIANVAEEDSPLMHVGQSVNVRVMALPDRQFSGKVAAIGASIDPGTHRVLLRSEIRDPRHELRPGMFATYIVNTGKPVKAVAVPMSALVREGDGTMTVWVTSDRTHFTARTVQTGLEENGYDEIVSGLSAGELVATDGALFLDNAVSEAAP